MTAPCILCGATATDRAGALKHEGACPHFMRGPDPGGDPSEWTRIPDGPNIHPTTCDCPSCREFWR